MSLNWEFSGKAVNGDKIADEQVWKYADCIIWLAVAVDMSTLNEKNIDEWIWRQEFLIATDRAMVGKHETSDDIDVKQGRIPVAVLRKACDLSVNVSTMTRKQWFAKQIKIFSRRADEKVSDVLRREKDTAVKL